MSLAVTLTGSGGLTIKTWASDRLGSSSNGVCGMALNALCRARVSTNRRDFTVSGKLNKEDYPWPRDADPNNFQNGIPVDPIKKVNMKKREKVSMSHEEVLRGEFEKLKEQVVRGMETSAEQPPSGLNETIKKLEREIDSEYAEAAKSLGLEEKIVLLREELSKASSKEAPALKEKFDKLKEEFDQNLPAAPNFKSLNRKLGVLKELSEVKSLSDKLIKGLKQISDRPDLKHKIEALRAETEKTGASSELDQGRKKKIVELKNEIDSEFDAVLKSLGLHDSPLRPDAKKVNDFNREVHGVIEDIIKSSPDLKNKIEMLKMEVSKARKCSTEESRLKIQALDQQIKQRLAEALDSPELKEKHKMLKAKTPTGGSN